MKEKITQLPHWCITDLQPAFYDTDSLTAVEQTGKVYSKVRELVDAYNNFVDVINKHLTEFEEGTNKSIEVFEIEMRQEFQDFIDIVNLKIKDQDKVVQDAVDYMKLNLSESITSMVTEMKENGEFDVAVANAFEELGLRLVNTENNIDMLSNRTTTLENTIIIHVDNIEQMLSSELKSGDVVKTLGYYEPNDGGGALYLIREKTESDIIDNGSLHLLNNGLVAELIVNNEINVKQFGAKGDGINDDTNYIQNAIDYLANIIKKSDIANNNIINIPAGKYKITSKISLSRFIKIRTTGFVALLSYVENGSTLHIEPTEDDLINSIGDRHDWFRGPIINGDGGLIIKFMGENNENAIGLEIGLNTLTDYGTVARFNMQEFRIQGFNIGMLVNRYRVYIAEFRRISFEGNTIGVQYSDVNGKPNDAGEKISYIECIFSRNDISLKWLCEGMDSYFINTSFDFNKCVFNDPNNTGYRFINLLSCHLEGNGIANKEDVTIPSGIVYGQMRSSKINIISCDFYSTYIDYLFYCESSKNPEYILSFRDNKLTYASGQNKTGLYFLATDNVTILEGHNNSNCYGEYAKFLKLNNMLYEHDFSKMELGEFTYDSVTNKIGGFKLPYKYNELNEVMNIVESPFGKALKLTKNRECELWVRLTTELIPVVGGRSVIANICKNISSQTNITISYYDKDKNLIGKTNDYHYESSEKEGDLYMSDCVKRLYLNHQTHYIDVSFSTNIPISEQELIIYGMFVQYE